jgi:UDP-N-acetylmuramoyl-L-alanyl-D-glutamate--2,6-diaminopimelate ligase
METFFHFIKRIIPVKLFKKLQPAYHFVFAFLAAIWYKFPSEKIIVIGVTGTTGKSTSVHLIVKTLESAGYKVGYTSTAMFKVADKEWMNDKKITMPGRFFTQSMLRRMVKAGCEYAIIETTSQGIEQFRHRFINYDILIFTGLYPEHIEAHGGFENYKLAKGKLFAHLAQCKPKYAGAKKKVEIIKNEIKKIHLERIKKTIIVNGDDEHKEYFLGFKAEEKLVYKVESHKVHKVTDDPITQVIANNVAVKSDGVQFFIDGIRFNLQLMGEFNIYNALTAVSVGLTQNLTLDQIKTGLENIAGVPGRFEKIDGTQDFTVIVDYAFEPNAVKKLYEIIKLIEHNRIIHVLGSAGGGRDIARRPILGKVAGENADLVIVTNEDPYDDDPQIIIDQVALGAEKAGKVLDKSLFKILDRREAIKKALQLAGAGDLVLITGKGCEQAICVAGGKKVAWDDRKVAREELEKLQVKS